MVELGAWNRISFVVVGEDDSEVALWYTNAKFEGAITAAEKTGDAWDKSLYHESADGNRWMPGQALKYKLVYDPSTNTMTVSIDKTAPVITVADAVLSALAAHDFVENEDASALFGQLLAGISANDDFDGAITVTQEMVNLGGLNPAKLVEGDYTITIAVTDAAGNRGTKELKLHVRGIHANVDLLADLPASGSDYKSANWKVEKYTDKWTVLTDVQMRSRTSTAGVRVTNMSNGYSMTMRFTFSTGKSLGIANTLSLKVGNYWSNAQEMSVKIKVVDVNGNETFILGDANNWVTIPKTEDVVPQTITFSDTEVKAVVFITKSAVNGSTFLYMGDVHLTYEEPAPSPSANN